MTEGLAGVLRSFLPAPPGEKETQPETRINERGKNMMTTMNFHDMAKRLSDRFDEAKKKDPSMKLYQTDADSEFLWALYLNAFPAGTNPMYRKRTEHDCSCCRHFFRDIGGAVMIGDDLSIHPVTEFDAGNSAYQTVMDAVTSYVKSCSIKDVYVSRSELVGTVRSNERDEDGTVLTYEHLHLWLPDAMVADPHSTIDSEKAKHRDTRNVFKRSLDEISEDAVETVLELIADGSLYRGEEWAQPLVKFLAYMKSYNMLDEAKKEVFCWKYAPEAGAVIGRIRNHSIGVLLTEITQGMDLDAAVSRYEAIVAPTNYKRPKAIYTAKMLEDAAEVVKEKGYMDSLQRRFATADDISVNNILYCNRDAAKCISAGEGKGSVFDEMKAGAQTRAKNFSRVEEVTAETFVSRILPGASGVEAYMESRFAPNMVSLIAPVHPEAPGMFKWDNAFSWAYAGNMTDSDIKRNVKSAGGRVDGVLRFSIQWNDETFDQNDLDAHCMEPDRTHIFYGSKVSRRTGGNLDVDIIHPQMGVAAVENITYPYREHMTPGLYQFYVNCYSFRGGKRGFQAEIEFEGQVCRFRYDKPMRQGENVLVAGVLLGKDGRFTIQPKLPLRTESRTIWGVKTNTFVPVSIVMFSPNYWDGQQGVGNKHYMFMLKDCVNPEKPNGFYNEFLKNELLEHKRVFEALGSKMAVAPVNDQLSGIGFSSTRRNDLVVRVKGNTERTLKIRF